MESRKEYSPPSHGSSAQQQLPMVDPKYPLPQSLPVSAATQQFLLSDETNGNGMARTSSRRRKVSGRSQGQAERSPQPIAPEAPKAPPVSYDYPYLNESPTSPTNNNLATFAARARAAPSDLQPGNLPEIGTNTLVPNSRPVRRGSINRPPGAVYLEIRGTERKSLSSPRANPNSPRFSTNITTAKPNQETEPSFPRRASSVSTPSKAIEDTAHAQPHSASRRVSSGSGPGPEWASDRSPLQKLELKLNDISKEEKRARVEEAEQLLKQSKAGGASRDPGHQLDFVPNRRQSVRISSGNGQVKKEPLNSAANSPREASALDNQKLSSQAYGASKIGETRSSAPSDRQRHASSSPQLDSPHGAVRLAKTSSYTPSRGSPAAIPQSGQQSARGMTSQGLGLPGAGAQRANGRVASIPRESEDRYRRSSGVDQADGGRGYRGAQVVGLNEPREEQATMVTKRSGPVQQTVGSIRKTVTTKSPDFPAADLPVADHRREQATQPNKSGGLNSNPGSAEGASVRERHHLSDLLHHHRDGHSLLTDSQESHPRRLNEWRQGQTARLTVADLKPRKDATSNQNAWWEGAGPQSGKIPDETGFTTRKETQSFDDGYDEAYAPSPASFNPPLYLKCGPLLRYTGLKRDRLQNTRSDSIFERETWRGSVMIVTTDSGSSYDPAPVLHIFHEPMDLLQPPPQSMDDKSDQSLPSAYVDPIAGLPKLSRTGTTIYVKPVEDLEHEVDLSRIEDDGGLFEETRTAAVPTSYGQPGNQPKRNINPSSVDSKARYLGRQARVGYQHVQGIRLSAERGVTFWRFNIEVELGDKQTRIAYRINNSASVGFWVPARGHSMNVMFHTCNGFSMSVDPAHFSGPDPLWRDVLNHHQTRPFHVMIGGGDQIYNDAAMTQTTLFRDWLKIKNPHHKHEALFSSQMREELETFYLERYSMWFSQGLFGMANSQIPMINMWDDHDIIDGFGSYPDHFMRTPVFCGVGAIAHKYYMLFQHQSVTEELTADEPSWLLGATPGPYIHELSRSVFVSLGKRVALLGLDCRTERRRDEILSEASYDLVFERCRRELIEGETKHLIVVLGVPIAYPRLVWLENLLTSRVLDPIKALGRTGMLGGFLNKFDGSVEILDDLDDHWTSKNHKHERNWFIQELQELAAEKSVRVTILGGDVHLAAIGQFYSNPKLKIPKDQDHRYMANVISSAIVNTPPPEMMGDILNKRNKIHHLDDETEENMIPMFTHDVDGKPRNNKRLLPRRNWCSLKEYHPGTTPPPTPPPSLPQTPSDVSLKPATRLQRTLSLSRNDVKPGNLLRRLSQRGAPLPKDYPPSNEYRSSPTAVASSPPNSPTDNSYFSARHTPAIPTFNGNSNNNSSIRHSSAPVPRPGNFHRRPTNLSIRAAKKGDEDQDGGHINLEYGLDVVLNCEVNQKDPAGLTTPYRLLIPALWYQGEGDSNAAEHKKKGWIKRIGSVAKGRRRKSELAKRQGQGNWGGYSDDSQSVSDSELENEPGVGTGRYGLPPPRTERGAGAILSNSGRESLPPQRRASGNAALYAERRSSKVDDMLGMAGPVDNGNRNANVHANASGNGSGSGRWSLGTADARFQTGGENGNGDPESRWENGNVKRSASGKGYGGIEAYRESRWRRFF